MRKSLAVLTSLAVFGTLGASAATLGGLNSATLGADQTVVSSCDTDGISLSFTNEYSAASNAFLTKSVTMTDVEAPCADMSLQLALSNGTTALATVSSTVAAPGGVQTVTLASPVPASSVTAASLVISG